MEASSDGGTCPLGRRVRMWAAGCRKGSDLSPLSTPLFSTGIKRACWRLPGLPGQQEPPQGEWGHLRPWDSRPCWTTRAILEPPWLHAGSRSSSNSWQRGGLPAPGDMTDALPWGTGGVLPRGLIKTLLQKGTRMDTGMGCTVATGSSVPPGPCEQAACRSLSPALACPPRPHPATWPAPPAVRVQPWTHQPTLRVLSRVAFILLVEVRRSGELVLLCLGRRSVRPSVCPAGPAPNGGGRGARPE